MDSVCSHFLASAATECHSDTTSDRVGVSAAVACVCADDGDGRDVRIGPRFVGETRQAKRFDARTETQRTFLLIIAQLLLT